MVTSGAAWRRGGVAGRAYDAAMTGSDDGRARHAPIAGPSLRVQLIGRTEFVLPDDVPFTTDTAGGQAIAEFAGRSIYRSWSRPRPATATNQGFLQHLIAVGHLSVLEHASATFHLQGLSTPASAELLRHRHLSFSQLSPRTAPEQIVEPAAIAADPALHQRFSDAVVAARAAYDEVLAQLEDAIVDTGALAHKQARQAAGALLPQGVATSLVVSGNYRAWRHVIGMRATDAADVELRAAAVAVLRLLQHEAPHVFADFRISALPDGTETAASPFIGNG